jgi:hypothetical protein
VNFVPPVSEEWVAACSVGPSAMGSEKGAPSSSAAEPALKAARAHSKEDA